MTGCISIPGKVQRPPTTVKAHPRLARSGNEVGMVDSPRTLAAVTVLVDDAIWPWQGRRWAHLVSDESYEELHAFAARLGIPRRVFQGDHYDVPTEIRAAAVDAGAVPVDGRELVVRLRAAGLRRTRKPGTQRLPSRRPSHEAVADHPDPCRTSSRGDR